MDAILKNKKINYKKKGLRHYRKKQYVKAISCFEKVLREGKKDPKVYLYIGYSSLYAGDIEGARRYFKGGLIAREGDVELMKGLAYVYLKDERIEDTISLWGEILAKNPKERVVQRALDRLRETENIKEFIGLAKPRDYFSPRPPLYTALKPYLVGVLVTLGILIVSVIFYTTPLYKKALGKFFPEIVELNKVTLPRDIQYTQKDVGGALYSFTDKEIESSFLKIKKYIQRNKINQATIYLNKIMLSNATTQTKERFEILYTFLNPSDPFSIDYNPRYYEILKEPLAFKGVYVVWTGRIANLKREKNSLRFDLLVNYGNEDTIEGLAQINLDGTYYIENKQKVEIFGSFVGYDKETGKLLIKGILLRDLEI